MKLFRVEVSFTYYCLAEDESEAREYASDAAGDFYLADVADTFDLTNEQKLFLADGWNRDCLVYGTDSEKDVKLGDAWDKRLDPSDLGS